MKAIAFCGLACCVCSKNKGCVGCQDEAVKATAGAKTITVVKKKG